MRILLPTGAPTEQMVRKAAAGYDADVVVTGEIASFLTPHRLRELLKKGAYDLAIVSGMCTASFEQVEHESGVPVYLGPRHAADLALILPVLGSVTLSRTVPADDFLATKKAEEAMRRVGELERDSGADCIIRGVKIGGESRMKVLAEMMDAHRCESVREMTETVLRIGCRHC